MIIIKCLFEHVESIVYQNYNRAYNNTVRVYLTTVQYFNILKLSRHYDVWTYDGTTTPNNI